MGSFQRGALLVLLLLGVSGCGADILGGDGDESASEDPRLVDAAYPECANLGRAVLRYLSDGDTSGHPELDQTFARMRADILAQPDDAREGLARAEASNAISRCDEQQHAAADEAAQEVAAEEARQEAEREAERRREAEEDAERRRAEEAAAEEAVFEDACTERGGYTTGFETCLVDYEGWAAQVVTLHPDGTFDTAQAEQNRADCEIAMQDAETSAADGWPWYQLPEYHEETGVCVYGSP
jgi:hypothetical protein